MKTLAALCALALGLSIFAYHESQQSRLLSQQVADYDRQVAQLLSQIEANSVQNIENGRSHLALENELQNRDSQIASLRRQLELAQQQKDPDYEMVQAQIREQVRREMASNESALSADPRISLVKQLRDIDPIMMGEVFALNAQYGDFLRGLDVSEERMEVIINALNNMIAEQNQARSDILQSIGLDPAATDRIELQNRMQAVASPESQREALSYDLTEAELDAFSEFQEQRQNSFTSFNSASTRSDFIRGESVRSSTQSSRGVQLLPVPVPLN